MKRVWIITGASRGIGHAVLQAAQQAGDYVIGLSRSGSAADLDCKLDMHNLQQVEAVITEVLKGRQASEYILLNNAGTINPIGDDYSPQQAAELMNLNVTAAVTASNAFIKALKQQSARKLIINLSSGASTSAIAGWSLYCASKAALDHFGRCQVQDQKSAKHPVDVLGFAPGKVDTQMQAEIRNSDSDKFPMHEQFCQFKEEGSLLAPETVAARLLAGVEQNQRYNGKVLHVETLLSYKA